MTALPNHAAALCMFMEESNTQYLPKFAVSPDQELLLGPEPHVVQVSTTLGANDQGALEMAAAKLLHGQAPWQFYEHGNLSEEAGFE